MEGLKQIKNAISRSNEQCPSLGGISSFGLKLIQKKIVQSEHYTSVSEANNIYERKGLDKAIDTGIRNEKNKRRETIKSEHKEKQTTK